MKNIIEMAYEINALCDWDCGYLPFVKVGERCHISEIWDGKGEEPEESYSYRVSDNLWLKYEWEKISGWIVITNISFTK